MFCKYATFGVFLYIVLSPKNKGNSHQNFVSTQLILLFTVANVLQVLSIQFNQSFIMLRNHLCVQHVGLDTEYSVVNLQQLRHTYLYTTFSNILCICLQCCCKFNYVVKSVILTKMGTVISWHRCHMLEIMVTVRMIFRWACKYSTMTALSTSYH